MRETRLTKSEQAIYDELMDAIKQKEKRKVSQIAEKVKVADSSVIKLTKRLGYSGWNEMYYALTCANNDTMPLSFDHFNFIETIGINEKLDSICEMLLKYKDCGIVLQTVGDVEALEEYLLENFWKRGFTCFSYSQEVIKSLHAKKKEGVTFFICESGIVFLDLSVYAKEHEFHVISITSNEKSPLSSNSDISINLKNNKSKLSNYEPNYFTARVLIFLELMFVKLDEKQNTID